LLGKYSCTLTSCSATVTVWVERISYQCADHGSALQRTWTSTKRVKKEHTLPYPTFPLNTCFINTENEFHKLHVNDNHTAHECISVDDSISCVEIFRIAQFKHLFQDIHVGEKLIQIKKWWRYETFHISCCSGGRYCNWRVLLEWGTRRWLDHYKFHGLFTSRPSWY